MTLEMYMREREMNALNKGLEQGLEQGFEKGRTEERFQMVKSLLLANTPIEYIKAATGWSEDKILQCEKNLTNPAE